MFFDCRVLVIVLVILFRLDVVMMIMFILEVVDYGGEYEVDLFCV